MVNKILMARENIRIKDSVSFLLETDAVIYRQELEKYWRDYVVSKTENTLIFMFIFLQIYIECFLHQNMRRIIRMEFQHIDPRLYKEWQDKEDGFVKDKVYFFASSFESKNNNLRELESNLVKNFKFITSIRNKLIHGHSISESMTDNIRAKSKTKELLNYEYFQKSIEAANNIGKSWNEILDVIKNQFKALRKEGIGNFKFEFINS